MTASRTIAVAAAIFVMSVSAWGAPLSGPSLVRALRQGGYVIVMRHAHAPTATPDAGKAAPGNTAHERQLDDPGTGTARAMGQALRDMKVEIGKIYSSPTFRARQTVALVAGGKPELVDQLGDGGHSMARIQTSGPGDWLLGHVAQAPAPGTDTLIVTQMPNIVAAFPSDAPGMGDGEALIFRPARTGKAELVAKVPIEQWPMLAKSAR